MQADRLEHQRFPGYGECIYCGISEDVTKLTDEHVVAFALGGNVIIENASCEACAAETSKCEREIARNVLADFRTHTNIQTRRPKDRPTELLFNVSLDGAEPQTLTVPVKDHPFFTPMPVWGMPGLLRGMRPEAPWALENKAHLFYSVPDNLARTVGLQHGQRAELPFPTVNVNHELYARAIAKIAYCQAVVRFGLRGFRRLVLPKLILGRYPHIRYFVGSDPDAEPPPRLERSILHAISFEEIGIGNMRLILAAVRLFANSGTDSAGPPIYRVIVGAPLSPRARRS
jgi:hypothetical protein